MLGRERRQERRQERREHRPTRYQMREKVFAIGDDYWITDDSDRRVFKVNGKALRLRQTFIIEDPNGTDLIKIQSRPIHIRDAMEIEDLATGRSAKVKKALISPLRDRFVVAIDGSGEWRVKGNILEHEYEVESDQGKVAEVSKQWFRIRDSYGIAVEPDQEDALVIAVAVCLDEMAHG